MKLSPLKQHFTPDEKGQSLVEMTLGFGILILLFMGIVDIARAYFVYVAMEDSVGEAAVYMSINPDCRFSTDGPDCADPNNAWFRAQNASNSEIEWSRAVLQFDRPGTYGVGETVVATLSYRFELITPVISRLFASDGINLQTSASQTILTEKY